MVVTWSDEGLRRGRARVRRGRGSLSGPLHDARRHPVSRTLARDGRRGLAGRREVSDRPERWTPPLRTRWRRRRGRPRRGTTRSALRRAVPPSASLTDHLTATGAAVPRIIPTSARCRYGTSAVGNEGLASVTRPETTATNAAAYRLLRSMLQAAEEEELIDRAPPKIRGAARAGPADRRARDARRDRRHHQRDA